MQQGAEGVTKGEKETRKVIRNTKQRDRLSVRMSYGNNMVGGYSSKEINRWYGQMVK